MKIDRKSMVVLCGAAGSGKSTFAGKSFLPTEIVSSDGCRAMVSDDEDNMAVSREAFEIFYLIIEKRMKSGKLVVADSTALTYDARKRLLELAQCYGYFTALVAFDLPLDIIKSRNNLRERKVPPEVVERQYTMFKNALKFVYGEGFDEIVVLKDCDVDSFKFDVAKYNFIYEGEKFDIISDIHGCLSELEELLTMLGYIKHGILYTHPEGRKVIYAGDIADRGPKSIDTINLVINMVSSRDAYYIPGNHCNKFYRYLKDRKVHVKSGFETTVLEYENLDRFEREKLREDFIKLYELSPLYLVLDEGKLVVAHAGICDDMIGKTSKKVEEFVLYGSNKGENSDGLNIWVNSHKGDTLVVYGHIPVSNPEFINNTIDIDQGVSAGGCLAALRYPEKQVVTVKSSCVYYLDGKQIKEKGSHTNIEDYNEPLYLKLNSDDKIKIEYEEVKNSIDEIHSMSQKGQWVVFIPPVIPCINSHDIYKQCESALDYYRSNGSKRNIIQSVDSKRKYIIIICKSNYVSKKYFFCDSNGEIYSQHNSLRDSEKLKIINRLHSDLLSSGYFKEFSADFIIFEAVIREDMKVIPLKVICTSRNVLYNKDSMWQMENLGHLTEHSDLFINSRAFVIDTINNGTAFVKGLLDDGIDEFYVKPSETLPQHHEMSVQSAILCSSHNILAGEGFFELSKMSHKFSNFAVEKFVNNKLSKGYFQYVIGSVALNHRINKMRM